MLILESKLRALIREVIAPVLLIELLKKYIEDTSSPLAYRLFVNYLLGPAGIKKIDNKYLSYEYNKLLKEAAIATLRAKRPEDLSDPDVSVVKDGMQVVTGISWATDEKSPFSNVDRQRTLGHTWTPSGEGSHWDFENSLRLVHIEYNKRTKELKVLDTYDFNSSEDGGFNIEDVIANFKRSFPNMPPELQQHNALETLARSIRQVANEFDIEFTFKDVEIKPRIESLKDDYKVE